LVGFVGRYVAWVNVHQRALLHQHLAAHLRSIDDAAVRDVVANDADPMGNVHAPRLLLIHPDTRNLRMCSTNHAHNQPTLDFPMINSDNDASVTYLGLQEHDGRDVVVRQLGLHLAGVAGHVLDSVSAVHALQMLWSFCRGRP
jgi:hypothetical protein